MPDPGMPYYDPTQNQFSAMVPQQQPLQYQMPDQSMGYNSYLSNNQYLMNNQQSQLQQTMATAQYNFHQHMQNVLQGSMAAGMAIYNTGKSVVDKSREHMYQDMLVNEQGAYVLQRSFGREFAWGSGLAGSDLGRALKIGGRQPEFLSQDELQFQMDRAWGHRKTEMLYGLGGGVTATGSSLVGMTAFKKMGMAKSLAGGMVLDWALGGAYEQWIAPKEYAHEFRKFTENQDLNEGVGIRRLSGNVSDALAGRFYAEDRQAGARMIPFVGDILADRMGPNTKRGEFTKKMMTAGLFRDQDLNDVDKMEAHVRDTIKVVEKFAGLAHTTKDAILNIKATLNKFGMNDAQQNQAISGLTSTSISTGLDLNTLINNNLNPAMSMALGAGYNKSIVGSRAVGDVGALKAMQEAGLLDRMYDPGSLSMQNMNSAMNYNATGWGMVNRFGQGNIGTAKSYFSSMGGGNTAVGMMFNGLPGFVANDDPISTFRNGVKNVVERFGGGQKGLAVALSMARTQEEKLQVMNAAYDTDVRGEGLSKASAELKRAEATGDYSKISTFDTSKLGLNTKISTSGLFLSGLSDKLKSTKTISSSEDGEVLSHDYVAFERMHGEKVLKLEQLAASGDEVGYNKLREEIVNEATKNVNTSKSSIDRFIDLKLKEGNKISRAVRNIYNRGSAGEFLKGRYTEVSGIYNTGNTALDSTLSWLAGGTKVKSGYRSTSTERAYKIAEKYLTDEFLHEAQQTVTSDNARKRMGEILRKAGASKEEISEFSQFDQSIIHDTVYEAFSKFDSKTVEAATRKFGSLSNTAKAKFGSGGVNQYLSTAQSYGDLFTRFKTMLSNKDLEGAKKFLSENAGNMSELLGDLQGSKTNVWQKLLDQSSGPGSKDSIITALNESSDKYGTVLGDLGSNSSTSSGADPNTKMIESFTVALQELTKALK